MPFDILIIEQAKSARSCNIVIIGHECSGVIEYHQGLQCPYRQRVAVEPQFHAAYGICIEVARISVQR